MDTTVVVVGAGPAGLAMSRCLQERDVDHVVLERATVASSWRTERWDSLRLLTPNWLNGLPGAGYRGPDPDGFMTAAELTDRLDAYGRASGVPVRTGITVQSVTPSGGGYWVTTDHGHIASRAVVLATGACSTPRVPAVAPELPGDARQLTPATYRRPQDVGAGRVLVVGASSSGMQIADELARSGRDVTLAVGRHTRVPRRYRGRDIYWWMHTLGMLDTRYDEVDDLARLRRVPSLQLVGSPDHRDLDLNALGARGVQLVGRVVGVREGRVQLSGALAAACADADLKMHRLLDAIDRVAPDDPPGVGDGERPTPTRVPTSPNELALGRDATVVWATGYRPHHPWLDPTYLDRKGQVVHDGGVVAPGLYVLGLPFLRRRSSGFLAGIGPDAEHLSSHLAGHLDRTARPAVSIATTR